MRPRAAKVTRPVADTALSDREADRHRALADRTRLALLRVLEGASAPVDAHVLAERVGLHVNTVRWHLGILVDADLVHEQASPAGARGRPRHAYQIVPGALDGQPGGFRLLAEVLAEALEHSHDDVGAAVEEAGRVRGKTLVRPRPDGEQIDVEGATDEVVSLLDVFGFQPRLQREPGGQRIAMRPCPFGETAIKHSSIVCPVHLGLIRGALETLEAPIDAVELEPFARRDVCIAHLRATPAGRPPARVDERPLGS